MKMKLTLILMILFSFCGFSQDTDHELMDCVEGCWLPSFIMAPGDKNSIQFIRGKEYNLKMKNALDSGDYLERDSTFVFDVRVKKEEFLIEIHEDISYRVFYEKSVGKGDILVVNTWMGKKVNRIKARRIYRKIMSVYRSTNV